MEHEHLMMALALLLAYLLGSIPFGIIVARLFKLGDLRKIGSGNIGATNMVRAGGKKLGLLTLLLDALKGIIAALAGLEIAGSTAAMDYAYVQDAYLFGLVATLGHCYPIWLRFKGGKGVATALGVLGVIHVSILADGWWLVPLLTLCWVGIFKASRYVSLASLVTFMMAVLFDWVMYDIWAMPLLLALLIVIRHHENIKRLLNGTEHVFGRK